MAPVAERPALAEVEMHDIAIVGARVIDPEIIDGRIVGGRIVSGRVIHTDHLAQRTMRALHLDSHHRHTEIVALIGFGLAMLLVCVW